MTINVKATQQPCGFVMMYQKWMAKFVQWLQNGFGYMPVHTWNHNYYSVHSNRLFQVCVSVRLCFEQIATCPLKSPWNQKK